MKRIISIISHSASRLLPTVSTTRQLIICLTNRELRQLAHRTGGGDAKFDQLEGKDHFGTCDSAFSRERLAWIFGHSSSGVEPVADNVDDGNATVEARYDLSGRRVADGYQGIQIVRMTDGSVRKVANPKP